MKKFITLGIALSMLSVGSFAYAANQDKSERGEKSIAPKVKVSDQEVTVKVTNNTTKQPVATTTQTQATTKATFKEQERTREEARDGEEDGSQAKNQNKIKNIGNGNVATGEEDIDDKSEKTSRGAAVSAERRSAVATAVHELLSVADRIGGIGQQVRVIAQAQNDDQEKIEDELADIQERGGFAKFFIGPKDEEINKAKELLKQNQDRITKLNEIKTQLKNTGDQKLLEEQIKVLEQANIAVENSITSEEKGFSLFGWLFK